LGLGRFSRRPPFRCPDPLLCRRPFRVVEIGHPQFATNRQNAALDPGTAHAGRRPRFDPISSRGTEAAPVTASPRGREKTEWAGDPASLLSLPYLTPKRSVHKAPFRTRKTTRPPRDRRIRPRPIDGREASRTAVVPYRFRHGFNDTPPDRPSVIRHNSFRPTCGNPGRSPTPVFARIPAQM
jgi:hypothetical protein